MSKIAIFGGTFNPIHWGHLLLAETAFDQFHLDRVLWVPTFRPVYKAQPLLAFEHRLAMVHRAIADHPAFAVSAIDAQQSGTSYAIATFIALQALEPGAIWYWIVGSDAFQSLPKWQGSQTLMAQCRWLVAPRMPEGEGRGERREESEEAGEAGEEKGRGESQEIEDRKQKTEEGKAHAITTNQSTTQNSKLKTQNSSSPSLHWHPLHMPSVAISSSLIRQRCREGRSIRYLVPEAVHSYITEQNLYQMG